MWEILHDTLKDAIIDNPPKCFQPNLTLATYMDILSCRKSLKQIWQFNFSEWIFKNLALIIYHSSSYHNVTARMWLRRWGSNPNMFCRSLLEVQYSFWKIFTTSIVTGFGKTVPVHTRIEIHFIAYYNSYTQRLSGYSDTIAIDKKVCFYRRLFADPIKPCRTNSDPVGPLGCINRVACGL